MKCRSFYMFFFILMILTSAYTILPNQSYPQETSIPEVTTFRGGKQFAFLLCWDDGANDLEFSFYEDALGIKHTTFAVTGRISNQLLWGLDMLFRGHDIQSHAHSHVHLAQENESYVEYLVSQSVVDIEDLYGFTPILFAYPYGSQNSMVQEKVLQYFEIGRGIGYENSDRIGSWPISSRGNCKHSFPSVDGVKSSNMHMLIPTFLDMVSNSHDNNKAYKCYGHTRTAQFTEDERNEFFEILEAIASRNDTWLTSWGEAEAYHLEAEHLTIRDFQSKDNSLSFRTQIDRNYAYGEPLTYTIEIPDEWEEITILDDGKITDSYLTMVENGVKYVLLDSVPHGNKIEIRNEHIDDYVPPIIDNFRTIVTEEGVGFLVDIEDTIGLLSDVNITITCNKTVWRWDLVKNPIFWNNSTYGRVLFDPAPGTYHVKIASLDSSLNLGERTFTYVHPHEFRQNSITI